jgi:hypothetical protein
MKFRLADLPSKHDQVVLHSLLWLFYSVIFEGAKNRQKVTQFSEIGTFCRKCPFLKRKLRHILTENWGVIKFMPPD